MKSLLGEQLRYLADEEIARQIISGTYEIPLNLDPATTLVPQEIGRMGVKMINGEGDEIVISQEDFKNFWKRVKEFTSSSCRVYTTAIITQQLRMISAQACSHSN
jgi:hypothetical protein